MKLRRIITLVAALAVIAAAVTSAMVWFRGDVAESSDFPDGTFWLCSDATCGAEFVKSLDELGAFYQQNPNADLPCPDCGRTQTLRAARCTACTRHFPRPARGRSPINCPHCGEEQPRATGASG